MVKDNSFESIVNFSKYRFYAFLGSLFFLLISAFFLFSKGLNKGIDFTGGIIIEARLAEEFALDEVRKALATDELGEVTLQHFGSKHDLLLRISKDKSADSKQAEKIEIAKQSLKGLYPNVEFRRVDFVGPTVGNELIRKGVFAMLGAFLAILIYIWVRFDFESGFGAIIALVHDVLLAFGFLSLSGLEFNLTSVAAILIIVGYSINDSVVIYDRIRDNLRKYKKRPLAELIDKSLTETLRRTLLTGCTTLIAVLALILFGGQVLFSFSCVVFFGVVVGTYSSIYIAAPILLFFRKDKQN